MRKSLGPGQAGNAAMGSAEARTVLDSGNGESQLRENADRSKSVSEQAALLGCLVRRKLEQRM